MSDKPEETKSTRSRGTKGAFPRNPLKDTIALITTIYELGEGNDVRKYLVFEKLKRSANSGTTVTLLATANTGYGLTTGNSGSDYLNLTLRGRRIVESKEKDYEAIYDALYESSIFKGFINDFNQRRIPDSGVAVDALMRNQGLNKDEAEACWKIFEKNLRDYKLVRDNSGKPTIISREIAMENQIPYNQPQVNTLPATASTDPSPIVEEHRSNPPVKVSGITPQIHFNVQVVLPENAEPETYDAIFSSIAKHLLGRTDL